VPHIAVPEGQPGNLVYSHFVRRQPRRSTNSSENLLVKQKLTESRDRELIATTFPFATTVFFCHTSHGAIAAAILRATKNWDDVFEETLRRRQYREK